MKELQIYNNLLQLPLFLGISKNDISLIVAHTRFNFSTIRAGKDIVKEGDPCHELFFILNGKVEIKTVSDDGSYYVTEISEGPSVIQANRLFGLHQRYTRTYKALEDCKLISLDKKEVLRLSDQFVIFRINILNLLSMENQRYEHQPWKKVPQTLEDKITRFFEEHCIYPAGPKTFYIKMNQLALEVNDSRLDVSRALNKMQDAQRLTLYRGRIFIPALEKLLM